MRMRSGLLFSEDRKCQNVLLSIRVQWLLRLSLTMRRLRRYVQALRMYIRSTTTVRDSSHVQVLLRNLMPLLMRLRQQEAER